ncbi:peptidoglycan D,D-transpeptidase FtsI family protein [Planctomycetota bacterium]
MKSVRITKFFLLLIILAFASLIWRCFHLQHFRYAHYRKASLKQRQRSEKLTPQRGAILDRRARVLAASNKFQTIFADASIIKDIKETSNDLAPILDMPAHQICKTIEDDRNSRYIKLKTDASPEQCDAVRGKFYGIGIESSWKRYYPTGPLTAQILGFTDTDGVGLDGIELAYNSQLQGSGGENLFFADAYRRPIGLKKQYTFASDGLGIILTIDASIQQFAREELLKQYKDFEAESAIAVVAEPSTGAILAMVSLPDFDPANRNNVDPNTFRNRSVTDVFEPGSMIKPIVAAIALDNEVISVKEKINCEKGNYRGKGFGRVNEYRDHRFGKLTVRQIIIKSSNIGMAKIGQKLGKERLRRGLSLFGFGRETGVDLPGEVTGLLRPLDKWTGYSVTRIPYGYELNVTAIQMVRAFCILANGGHAVEPFLVKATVSNTGEIVTEKRFAPPIGFVINPEVAKWMVQDCLVGVVNEKKNGGTGYRAKLDKWQVFGKTGTANIAKQGEKGYAENSNLASFIAGAPAEDPAIVVLVSIRKPNGRLGKGDSGGAVASPAAARIIQRTLEYLESHNN